MVDTRLADVEHLAGDYSIADMATYPWLRYHENRGQQLEDYPHLKRWYDARSPSQEKNHFVSQQCRGELSPFEPKRVGLPLPIRPGFGLMPHTV